MCPPRGSSPLARGTPINSPAIKSTMAVHPHSRGEHVACSVYDLPAVRFIPTRAGNTSRHRVPAYPPPVHPHSRGEHRSDGVLLAMTYGSSPLARGTR